MGNTQNVLHLVLSELKIPMKVTTVADRKTVQKSVYLAQAVGVPLGYSFSWYLMGPYSPGLTRDYYGLLSDGSLVVTGAPESPLKPVVAERLRELRPLLDPPSPTGLSQPDWLELLASVHYLSRRMGLNDPALATKLGELKPHLSPYLNVAQQKMAESPALFAK